MSAWHDFLASLLACQPVVQPPVPAERGAEAPIPEPPEDWRFAERYAEPEV